MLTVLRAPSSVSDTHTHTHSAEDTLLSPQWSSRSRSRVSYLPAVKYTHIKSVPLRKLEVLHFCKGKKKRKQKHIFSPQKINFFLFFASVYGEVCILCFTHKCDA
ncbi:hypothetical protein GOODEAATRI_005200 [Goodea atripinnis]|uniref:Uncharacterized protein n=1 Tax=Goodea atripinnis TaxID=208336 RepID=A0ABV0NHN4_9TELE